VIKTLLIVFIISISVLQAQKLEKVTLQLQWKYQFQFAGFIIAKEQGFYEEVGLDVKLLEYNNTNIIDELLQEKSDFLISNSIVVYKDKKLRDVTLLATYFQRSPLIIVTQPEIKNVLDLRGKKLMLSENDLKNSSLSMLLEYFSINSSNTKILEQTFSLEEFIKKEVDAVAVFKSNEVFELKKRNIPFNIIDPVEYGFSTNAINLFTTHKMVQNRQKLVNKFLQASKKGWNYALEHIDEVALLIHEKYQTNKSLELLKYEGRVTKELMLLNLYDIGEINEDFVNKTYKQLLKSKKITQDQNRDMLIYKDPFFERRLNFSKKEKLWIYKHPIVTYSEIDWKPLSIIENSTMKGIIGDYLNLVSERTGITFKYIPSDSWPHVLEQFKDKKIDLVPGVGSSPQEMALGSISEVYASYPMAIVTGEEYSFLDSLEDLKGKVIAVPKYYTSYNFIVKHYPNIKLLETQNIEEALLLVQSGKADAFVGHLATSLYALSSLNLRDLKISGTTSFIFEHRYLIQDKYPELVSIINKALKSINEHERNSINANWIRTKVEKKIDESIIWKMFLFMLLVTSLFLWRQRTLKSHNKELKKLKERNDLAIDGNKDVIWDWNLLTNSLYVSPRWKGIVGYREGEVFYEIKRWKKLIHPDDLRDVLSDISENIKGKTQYLDNVHRLKHSSGDWIWIRIRGKTHYDSDGQAIRMTGTHTDVTQERKQELKYNLLAQMVEQTHDSVIATDLEGLVTNWNKGSEILLEYSAKEMIGKHIKNIYPSEDYEKLLDNIKILQKEEEYHGVVRLVKKSGTIIFANLSLSILKDSNDEPYGMVGYSQDITERKKTEDILHEQKNMLDYQAHHDALTGLPNRMLFMDRLHQAIEKAKRNKTEIAIFFIDLDRFKQINDSLGHDIGDRVLNIITKRLNDVMRQEDTLARLGGDEFTIIMENLKNSQDASILADKILKVLEEVMLVDGHNLYISCSIGISVYPKDENDALNLLKDADAAMYRAKDEGRNNYQFYSAEMTELAFERVVMETSLRQAIKNEEFVVYYQVQMDARTDTLIGMEALVRWNHSIMGLVSPAKFIPLAEDTGLIVEIDRLVMKQAMKQFMIWHNQGLNPGTLALNLAIKQLENVNFLNILHNTMQEYGFQPEWLELEVTEGDVMKNPEEAIVKLKAIHDLHVAIAVDDFGTGYSSLSYLKRFPITKLKVDQSFVRDIPQDEEDSAIVKAIIALGKSLNLNLIAEGVEILEQKEFLVENGCYNIQGYFYAKPLSAKEMEEFLKDAKRV
jgi:diguanylate cyclase (GGDEF)-like protein/PAS domain S-box-containing protein